MQQLQRLDAVIHQKTKELEDLRLMLSRAGSIDYAKDRVRASPSTDAPFVRALERITDLEAEINREVGSFVDKKHEIISEIQGLSNAVHVQILFKRYVEFKRLEVISAEMNYAYTYTRALHRRALQDFERTYTKLH